MTQSTQNTAWNTDNGRDAIRQGTSDTNHTLYVPGMTMATGQPSVTTVNCVRWGSLDITNQTIDLKDGNVTTPGGAQYVNCMSTRGRT